MTYCQVSFIHSLGQSSFRFTLGEEWTAYLLYIPVIPVRNIARHNTTNFVLEKLKASDCLGKTGAKQKESQVQGLSWGIRTEITILAKRALQPDVENLSSLSHKPER